LSIEMLSHVVFWSVEELKLKLKKKWNFYF